METNREIYRGGMKVVFALVIFLFLSLQIVSAQIKINEVELNPAGLDDSGNEWVELYNPGDKVSFDGWYLQNSQGGQYFLPAVSSEEFFVVDSLSDLIDINENVRLFDNLGNLIDSTGPISDTQNDVRTMQRIPNGGDTFGFKDQTKGISNNIINITNPSVQTQCIVSGEDFVLESEVSGTCIQEVVFSVFLDGEWMNFSGSLSGGMVYSAEINGTLLPNSENVEWEVSVRDCSNIWKNSLTQSFYSNSKTMLNVYPDSPDGENDWYVTEPIISLENPDAVNFYYKWDSEGINYNDGSNFGLENGPNNLAVIGGTIDLNYWANLSCGEENHKKTFFSFDFEDLQIVNILPMDNSSVAENTNFDISAKIDEIYGSNSGVDLDSVKLYINGGLRDANVMPLGSQDAKISYTANLPPGDYLISVIASDKAGRITERDWIVHILESNPIGLEVYSPTNGTYDNRRVSFDMTTSIEVAKIEYMNLDDNRPRFITLCRNCEEYGHYLNRLRTLNEGENNLVIRATGYFGEIEEKEARLFLDSRLPTISRTNPIRGFASGEFSVKFREENPEELVLFYGNESLENSVSVDLDSCEEDRGYSNCNVNVSLEEFHLSEVSYYFRLTDIVGNEAESRARTLDVDIAAPIINNFEMEEDGRRIHFLFEVNEENFRQITYIDYEDSHPREKRLCSRLNSDGVCEVTRSFTRGNHILEIFASDKAGNIALVGQNITFVAN